MSQPAASIPTLSYAAPLLDTERQPQAEAILLRNGTFASYLALFRTTREAAEFFERFQTTRFAPRTVDGVCKACGKATTDVAAVHWRAYFPRLEFSLRNKGQLVELATHHSLCRPCLAVTHRRIKLHRRSIAISAILAISGIAGIVWSAYWPRGTAEEVCWFIFAPSVLLVAATMFAFREHLADRQLPPGLRRLGVGVMTDIRAVETP